MRSARETRRALKRHCASSCWCHLSLVPSCCCRCRCCCLLTAQSCLPHIALLSLSDHSLRTEHVRTPAQFSLGLWQDAATQPLPGLTAHLPRRRALRWWISLRVCCEPTNVAELNIATSGVFRWTRPSWKSCRWWATARPVPPGARPRAPQRRGGACPSTGSYAWHALGNVGGIITWEGYSWEGKQPSADPIHVAVNTAVVAGAICMQFGSPNRGDHLHGVHHVALLSKTGQTTSHLTKKTKIRDAA